MAPAREERIGHRDEFTRVREPLGHILLRGLGLLPEAVALPRAVAGDRLEPVDRFHRRQDLLGLVVLLPRFELSVDRPGDEQRLVGGERGIVHGHARRVVDDHDHAAEPRERFGEDDVGPKGEHGHGREQEQPQGREAERPRSSHVGKLSPQKDRRHEHHSRQQQQQPPGRDVARESQAQVCGTNWIHAGSAAVARSPEKPEPRAEGMRSVSVSATWFPSARASGFTAVGLKTIVWGAFITRTCG